MRLVKTEMRERFFEPLAEATAEVSSALEQSTLKRMSYECALARYLREKELLDEGEDQKLLVEAMRQLPNLKTVEIAVKTRCIGAGEIRRSFHSCLGDEFEFSGEHCIPVVLTAIAESDAKITSFSLCTASWYYSITSPKHFLHSDCSRLLPTNIIMRHLCTSTCLNWVRQLTHLDITACLATLESTEFLFDSMKSVLTAATQLESLSFGHSNSNLEASFHDLNIPYAASKRIKHLDVANLLEADNGDIISLFQSRRDVLETVVLKNVFLAKGSWLETLQKMQTSVFTALKTFTLVCCATGPVKVDVTAYLRMETSKNPLMGGSSGDKNKNDTD